MIIEYCLFVVRIDLLEKSGFLRAKKTICPNLPLSIDLWGVQCGLLVHGLNPVD